MSGAAWLDAAVTSVAICWRVERRDGVAIGLTAHDRDIERAGMRYRAAPGMVPSAIARGERAGGAGLDVRGALTSEGISRADLIVGRWDGASVAILATDWQQPGAAMLPIASGTLGAVEMEGDGFSAELRDWRDMLEAPVSERTSPDCRAELGDRRCRVAMAPRRQFARVIGIDDRTVTLDRAEPSANAFGDGRLRWFGGGLSGLEHAILRSEGVTVTLRRAPEELEAAGGSGALVLLEQGCDKRLETCVARFANAINFQGEPYLPGIDLLTRYPGG